MVHIERIAGRDQDRRRHKGATMTNQTNTIATTILDQLGGNRFCVMTGAKNLIDLGNGLQLKLGTGAVNKANSLRVILEPSDTYTVEFHRITKRGLEVREVSTFSDIYADQLRGLISRETGFALSL